MFVNVTLSWTANVDFIFSDKSTIPLDRERYILAGAAQELLIWMDLGWSNFLVIAKPIPVHSPVVSSMLLYGLNIATPKI